MGGAVGGLGNTLGFGQGPTMMRNGGMDGPPSFDGGMQGMDTGCCCGCCSQCMPGGDAPMARQPFEQDLMFPDNPGDGATIPLPDLGGDGGFGGPGFMNDGFGMPPGMNGGFGPPNGRNGGMAGPGGVNGADPFAADPNLEKSNYAQRTLELVNQERAKVGAPPLQLKEDMNKAARDFSKDMVDRNYFSHVDPDGVDPWARMGKAGIANPGSENIAEGQTTPEEAVASWMESDGHRENLLNPNFKFMGIGVAVGANGRPKWAQNFAS